MRADAPLSTRTLPEICAGGLSRHSGYHYERRRRAATVHLLITVDDGGVSYYTMLADRLEARGWRGHCFVSTDAIGTRGFLSAAQIRELDARGHVIGSHSASHPTRFSACEAGSHAAGMDAQPQVLEDLLGHEVTRRLGAGRLLLAARRARGPRRRLARALHVRTDHGSHDEDGVLVIGRFTMRRRASDGQRARLVRPRAVGTISANGRAGTPKALIKPLLGPLYSPAADWVLSRVSPSEAGR